MMRRNRHSLTRNDVLNQEQKFSEENFPGWHPADIKAALEKQGLGLSELSRRNGYHPTAAGRALRTSWPEVEKIIADALHVSPQEIWPERYTPDGIPIKYLPRKRQSPKN
jgi:Ner family transcriptional regulator